MKLGFSTKLCEECSLKEIEELARETGVKYVEFQVGKEQGHGLDSLYNKEESVKDMKVYFDGSILIPWVLATSVVIGEEKNDIENDLKILRRWGEIATELGASYLRVFPAHSGEIDVGSVVKILRYISDKLLDLPVSVLLETHGTIATGKAMSNIIEKVNRKNINAIWDIAHTIVHDETVEESYNYLYPYLKHVHIKDFAKIKDSTDNDNPYSSWKRFVPPGKGDFPLDRFLRLLQEKNYDGVVSLETPAHYANALQCLEDIVEFVEQINGN